MLTSDDVIAINKILTLCGAQRLNTEKDVAYLNAVGAEADSDCEYYKISQTVLLDRLKNQTGERNYGQLTRLKKLASANGCELEDKKPADKKNQTVKIFGFSV